LHSHRRRIRPLALLVLVLTSCLLAEAATAQGKRRFDPTRDFEQWEHFQFVEHPALSVVISAETKEIATRAGKSITQEEREKLRSQWELLRPRLVELERRFNQDPIYRGQLVARHQVTKFRPFREIEPEIRESEPPFLLVLQRTGDPRKDFTEHEISRYVVHGRDLLDRFREWILDPLGRTISPEHSTFVLAVLASQKRYLSYANALGEYGLYLTRAHYDPERRFAVTYPTRKNFDPEGYHALRHELVHAAMHAARTGEGISQDAWLDEGLAEFLASGLARRQDTAMSVVARQLIRGVGADPEQYLALLPIEDLVAAQGYEDVLKRIGRRLGGTRADPAYLSVFYREAHLFNEFLHDANDGRHRSRYLEVVGSNLDGRGGAKAFLEAFDGVDLAVLQREFLGWIDPALAALELPPTPSVETVEAVEAAAQGLAAPCGEFDPEALRALIETPRIALGRALAACRAGAAEDAVDTLVRALERTEPGEDHERLKRESARVRSWIALRDRYLDFLVKEGKKLDVELDGKRLRAVVKSIDGGELVLGANDLELERLELSRVPAFPLALAMAKHRKTLDAGWARIYPYTLVDDPRWKKLLKDDEPEAAALGRDAPGFAAEIADGRSIAPVASLLKHQLPKDAAEARALLDELRAALAAGGDRLPEGVRETLRPLACKAFETFYATEDPLDGLAGEVERLDGGRVRITYSFEEDDELGDFPAGVDPTLALGGLSDTPMEERLEVEGGGLKASGVVSRRHLLRLGGPIKIRYEISSKRSAMSLALVGLCGREQGRFAACLGAGNLIVIDQRSGLLPDPNATYDPGGKGTSRIELAFDGKGRVALSVNGKQVREQSCGSLRVCDVFLSVAGKYELGFDDVVLEGIPEPESLEPLRRRAVARGLEELGM